MSHLRLDDDLFSPVRFDATIGETSDSSEGDHSNAEEFSLTNSVKNKVTLGKSVVKSAKENELKSKESKFVNTCSPILTPNSSDKLNAKRHFSDMKLEKIKDHKSATVRKEKSESQQKRQELLYTENILDPNTPKLDISDKLHHKKSRPTSLLLKNGSTKQDSLKDIKKKQKVSDHSLKGSSIDGVQKSNFKLLAEKKLTSSSSSSVENSDIKLESSSMSIESKENTSINSLESEKCSSVTQEREKLSVGALHTSYEATIKKMIHNSISSEWTKIRQLMYMQQMSFYRELNKIKDEVEKQHLATTEHLYKVIEELMQMNATLGAVSNNKN